MAFAEFKFRAQALCRQVPFNLILSNDVRPEVKQGNPCYERGPKTLLLLGGYANSEFAWIYGTNIVELAEMYNLAVILPAGENSFYVDGSGIGRAYGRYVGMELVSYVQKMFHLPEGRENTFVGGVSMGGFGAIQTGLSYPEIFGKVFGFSSALIIHDIAGKKQGYEGEIADYEYYRRIFGDLDLVEKSLNNPETQIRLMKQRGALLPELYLTCGSGDFLLENNRRFHEFLQREEVAAIYREGDGGHDWKFWNGCLEEVICWLL
ncbi:MAG: acetylesterase [Clostridiales bacterium]|nr:acetylesterase [Clostridiales bacterium]